MQQNMRPISNPDFNAEFSKWQDIFSTAPDNQIKHYLLSGDPIAKLAAAAVMDQKSKSQAPAQPPTQSVINKLAQPQGLGQLQQMPQGAPQQQMPQGQPQQMAQAPQQPMPQGQPQQMADGGITELPLRDDMFDEASYAAGGIIAFEDGGYVPGFAEKSYVDAYDEYNKYLNDPSSESSIIDRVFGGSKDKYLRAKQKELNRMYEVTGRPRAGTLDSLFGTDKAIAPAPGLSTPTTAQEREAYRQRDELIKNFAKGEYDPKRGVASLVKPAAAAPVAEPANQLTGLDGNNQQPKPNVDVPKGLPEPKLSNTKFDMTNPFTNMTLSPKTTIDKEAYIGKAPNADDIQNTRKTMYEKAGVSETMYDDAKAKIKGQLSDIDGKEKDAVADAMIMAGLGIMSGKSQYALQNIGEGAIPAFKGYKEDLEKISTKKERLEDKIFALDDAKNKFRQTGADSDLSEIRALEKDVRNASRSYQTAQATLDESHNTKADNLKVTAANAALDIQKNKLDFALKQDGLSIQRASLAVQKFVAEKPELFDTILRNLQGSKEYQNADATTKNEMITKAVSDARSTAGAGSKGFTYLKELEASFNDRTTPVGKEYAKISNTNGLDAALKWKKTKMSEAARDAGIEYGGASATGNVVDFNSLK